jgi:hypothetical protein
MSHAAATTTALDREYVAICLAEQFVRVRLAADRVLRTDPTARDLGPVLLALVVRLATDLGLREEVLALVDEALRVPQGSDGAAA